MFDVHHCGFSALTLYVIWEQKLGSCWRLHVCVFLCVGGSNPTDFHVFCDVIEKFYVFVITVLICVPCCCHINYATWGN